MSVTKPTPDEIIHATAPAPSVSTSTTKLESVMTIPELLDQQSTLESEAAEVLPFDFSRCTRSLGPLRQSIYSCLTCNPIDSIPHTQAGICSSCSISCHTDHQLVELFVRRDFVCDCGTRRCNEGKCEIRVVDEKDVDGVTMKNPNEICGSSSSDHGSRTKYSTSEKHINKYDHNFDGQFCICERGKRYDPETETEDMYQCLACEDWRHASCLGVSPDSDSWDDLICARCVKENQNLRTILHKHAGGPETGMMIYVRNEGADAVHELRGQLTPSHEQSQVFDQHQALNETRHGSKDEIETTTAKRNLQASDEARPPEKRARLSCSSDHSSFPACKAPFTESDSLLAQAEPSTSNVFLAPGWRQRWCRCVDCLKILSEINWLGAEEEDVWEPEEDQSSAKSLHELGMEAFKSLPQEQMIEGLHAYNKLRDHMMNFLKPFADQNLTVTEEAIKQFFATQRDQIKKQVW